MRRRFRFPLPLPTFSSVVVGTAIVLGASYIVSFVSYLWTAVGALSAVQLVWYATAKPAGIKLHPQLTALLSNSFLWYLSTVRRLLERSHASHWLSWKVSGFSNFLVIGVGVVTVFNPRAVGRALGAVTLPVTVASAAMVVVVRGHVALTSALWRYMREDGSSFHLAMSCLLFMPVVLTLPTTLWYGVAICGMGGVAEVAVRGVATLLVTRVLGAGPIDDDGVGGSAAPVGCWTGSHVSSVLGGRRSKPGRSHASSG